MNREEPEKSAAAAINNVSKRNGISVIYAEGPGPGSDVASKLLYGITNPQTVLFLSGGKTPADLYLQLSREQKLRIGTAAMVDERYGKPMHENSNELMISRSGLHDYFKNKNIPFYPIIEREKNVAAAAARYNETVKCLLKGFSKSAAILGIGEDGHIAGIIPDGSDVINPLFSLEKNHLLVSYIAGPAPPSTGLNPALFGIGERVTLTLNGLSKMDVLIVLVFGERKQAALSALFEEGPVERLPARFLKNIDIASKTILITDRKI